MEPKTETRVTPALEILSRTHFSERFAGGPVSVVYQWQEKVAAFRKALDTADGLGLQALPRKRMAQLPRLGADSGRGGFLFLVLLKPGWSCFL